MKHNDQKDSHTMSSDRWLSVAEVDQFKGEVKVNKCFAGIVVAFTYKRIYLEYE